MFIIREIDTKHSWESFVSNQKEKTFLHSWNWGELSNSLGHKIWRLGIYDEGVTVGAVLVVKVKARRGTFIFVPQGPILKEGFELATMNFQILLDYLKELALEEDCDFIRISPVLADEEKGLSLFKGLGFRESPIHMHAELMWLLDLSPKEEKLLKDMRKTTRYSIHKAERDGVRIIKSSNPDDVVRFDRLYKETSERHKFTPYSLDYLQKEFEHFVKDNQALIFMAELNGEIIAAAIIIFYGGSAFYHHGASSNKRESPAAYLLQWEAIKEAKARNCNLYNFWGVAQGNENHPWSGLTLFKKGFGGFSKSYLPAQDLPLKSKYWLNFIVEKVRKARRRL